MRLFLLLPLALLLNAANASNADRYPEIRAVIREAETASANIPLLDDRGNPHSWAGDLYARAGYLEDAARAYGGDAASHQPYTLWRAHVVYGDLAGAEKSLLSIADPEKRSGALSSLGDLLWKMGEPAEARVRLKEAQRTAQKIANPEHRRRMIAAISQQLALLPEDPPSRISAAPNPGRRFDLQNSVIPLFPITTGGFRDLDSKEVADRAAADAEFMTGLYQRMAAGDIDGIVAIVKDAATPFRKALGLASVEHIMIQANHPEEAEKFAQAISESDADCTLAKAEALSAAAAAWLRTGESERAGKDFEAATTLVRSVRELPLGKISVAVSIATAQFKGGMVASSAETFRLALTLAEQMPSRPKRTSAPSVREARGTHYRDEAYSPILLGAIRARDLGTARKAADLWSHETDRASLSIVTAWLNGDQIEEALTFARSCRNPSDKISGLLTAARFMLDKAGAPDF